MPEEKRGRNQVKKEQKEDTLKQRGQEEKREKEEVTYIIAQMSPNLNMEVAKNLKKIFFKGMLRNHPF